jgi:undecaprenyl-diphosphatase
MFRNRVFMTDIAFLLKALLLGIVEGLTEFLPISSTGHLIVTSALLDFTAEQREIIEVLEIVIQFAAILAVCWAYRMKLAELTVGVVAKPRSRLAVRFFLMLIIAFIPAAILGLFFHSTIKSVLFNPYVVAGSLIVGGVLILIIELPNRLHPRRAGVDDMTAGDAVKIGLAQAVAMVPGVSRSGATIIGGLIFGLSRSAATEFSFFLAIPTMFAATVLDVYKHWYLFKLENLPVFAVGCIAAFLSAMWAVRFLLRFIASHTFVSFAYYRIVFGLIVFATGYFNLVSWTPD